MFHPPTSPPASTPLLGEAIRQRRLLASSLTIKGRDFRSVAMAAQLPRSPWQLSQPQSHRCKHLHTSTHELLYVLTHTCLHLLAKKNTTEPEKGRTKSRTSHTGTANRAPVVLAAVAHTNNHAAAPALAHAHLQP